MKTKIRTMVMAVIAIIALQVLYGQNRKVRYITPPNDLKCVKAMAILLDALLYLFICDIPKEIRNEAWNAIDHFKFPEDIANYDPNTDEVNAESIQKAVKVCNWFKENPDVWSMSPALDMLNFDLLEDRKLVLRGY